MSFLLVLLATTLLDEREKRHQTQFLDSSSIIYPEISPTSIGFQSEEFGGEYISPRGLAPEMVGGEAYGGTAAAAETAQLDLSPVAITIPEARIETVAGERVQVVESTLFVGVSGQGVAETQSLLGAAILTGTPVISSTSLAAVGAGEGQPLLSEVAMEADRAANTLTYFGQTVVGRFTGFGGSGQAQIIPYSYSIVGYDATGGRLFQRSEDRQILISPEQGRERLGRGD